MFNKYALAYTIRIIMCNELPDGVHDPRDEEAQRDYDLQQAVECELESDVEETEDYDYWDEDEDEENDPLPW